MKGTVIVTLFTLMLPAAMPELLDSEDIDYCLGQLALGLSPREAAESFSRDIKLAQAAISRRLDNYIHNWKHTRDRKSVV